MMRYLLMHKDVETAIIEFSDFWELVALNEIISLSLFAFGNPKR